MSKWQPIETAPKMIPVLLYQPAKQPARQYGVGLSARMIVDTAPTHPRKSTHWMPLPDAPGDTQ